MFWGVFAVLLTDLTRALDLSPGPLGVALFIGAGSSILTMAAFGWTADRLGRRVFLLISGVAMAVGISGLALAGSYAALDQYSKAKETITRALELDPPATLERWTNVKLAPYSKPKDLGHFRENLRKAGLPE